jgi:hypothetical protein
MRLRTLLVAALALLSLAPSASAARAPLVRQVSAPVANEHVFRLPGRPTHLALHWRRARSADVRVALGRHGRWHRVAVDETTPAHARETYGAVMLARGARVVRVVSDRRLARLTVVALTDRGGRAVPVARAATSSQPAVLRRADWGADESLRYDSTGKEIWPAAYYPVQKLIVHHTDTQNNDPNPAATIRSIYYYHAVTQGWGDVGYNFLIDESGRIYEGRHTIDYPPGASPTEEDSRGYGVTAAHASGYNSGTVGIALLGTLSTQDATPAARAALEKLLAWEADRHGIDPQGSSQYVNPVNGNQATFPNIAGHRDVGATECPGSAFYATLPTIRSDVAAMLAGGGTASTPAAVTGAATNVTRTSATLNGTVNPNGQQTTYFFQYGRSTAYGSSTPTASAGAGTTATRVSASIGGLARRTTYHFRLVAIDAQGGRHPGADATFRTTK